MSDISKAIKQINSYTNELKSQGLTPSSVHHILLERAADILSHNSQAKADVINPMLKYMLHVVKKPDNKHDYEKGMGRHYYCAVNYMGKPVAPVNGYYKNGLGHFGKSARSMLEENYTMALTMYHAGYIKQASSFLGRAVHMLCDICCLPHATCMTYFSPNGKMHHAYEDAAEYLYPEKLPPMTYEFTDHFNDRNTFEESLNTISEAIRGELSDLYSDPIAEIIGRLQDSEKKTAALLSRFAEDTVRSPEEAYYITDGMKLVPMVKSLPSYTVTVEENGLRLSHDRRIITHTFSQNKNYFSAAHRKNGWFSLAPVRCEKDLILTGSDFKKYDPHNNSQLFKAEHGII